MMPSTGLSTPKIDRIAWRLDSRMDWNSMSRGVKPASLNSDPPESTSARPFLSGVRFVCRKDSATASASSSFSSSLTVR